MPKRKHESDLATNGTDDSKKRKTSDKKAPNLENEARKAAKLEKEVRKAKKEAKRARKLAKMQAKLEATEKQDSSPADQSPAAEESASNEEASPEAITGLAYTPPEKLIQKDDKFAETFYKARGIKITDSNQQPVVEVHTKYRPISEFAHLPAKTRNYLPGKFESPTPIQAVSWPFLFDSRDVVGIAETGSGKTLAFGLPCVLRLKQLASEGRGVRAVIVSPTRELAIQIHEQMERMATKAGMKCVCVYGGVSKDEQRVALKKAQIVIATPGRLIDLMNEKAADISGAEYVCLDEADRMLDKGFEADIKKIIGATRPDRQTVMFTATWPPSVKELAATFMKKYIQITIGNRDNGQLEANASISQQVEVMDPKAKNRRLLELLRKQKKDKTLVFCLYKKEAARVHEQLMFQGFNVSGIHGDMSQSARQAALESFKTGKSSILVATDVAARGLDIPAVTLVINLTFPLTIEDYVHRIGRTGRAGLTGKAITFFTEHEKPLSGSLIAVLKSTNQSVPEDLLKFGNTIKKKEHSSYGAFYRAPEEGMKKATLIHFD